MIEKNKHHFNENFVEHPDYAIRAIERVAVKSFAEHCSKVEEMLNVRLNFFNIIPDSSKAAGYRTMEFEKEQLGMVYSLLPVLLSTDVQRNFKNVLPYAFQYPIGLHYSEDSLVQSLPALVTTDNINIIPALLDYTIERFIHKGVVMALLPQYANHSADYNLYENENLRQSLLEVLKKNPVGAVDISLTDIIFRYQAVINSSLEGKEAVFKTNLNEFREMHGDMIRISDFMFVSHIEKQTGESVAIVEEKDLLKVVKPQFSAAERQAAYQEKLEKKRLEGDSNEHDIRAFTL